MAEAGYLVTAGATLVAALAFFLATYGTVPQRTRRRTHDISAFFGISAVFLVLSGLRQVFAYLGETEMDRALILMAVVPAAFAVVPLAHMTSVLLGANRRVQALVVAAFIVLIVIGLGFFYAGGAEGPIPSYWGTEWKLRSVVARVFMVGVIVLPALACAIIILNASRGIEGRDARRLRRVGVAFLVYYLVFMLDAFALPGIFLIAERLITAAAAWVAHRAYARP